LSGFFPVNFMSVNLTVQKDVGTNVNYIYCIFYCFVGYRLFLLSKVSQYRRLPVGRQGYGLVGDGTFGTGERYERLAADGAAGGNLLRRNGKDLDCNGSFHWDGFKLEAGLSPAEDLHGENQRDNTTVLF